MEARGILGNKDQKQRYLLYISRQEGARKKNKKRKIRQLVTIDMDKVKGDNGLKEIVELADEEDSNGSLE